MVKDLAKSYQQTKRSLNILLREQAYKDAKKILLKKGINIDEVDEDEIEQLIDTRTNEMKSDVKKYTIGGAFSLLLTSMIGF